MNYRNTKMFEVALEYIDTIKRQTMTCSQK